MTATDASFTATAPLTRFALRRDRVRILVWVTAIVLLVVSTVASVKGLYPNQVELDKAAQASEDNAAAIVFNGPPQNLATVGGQVAFQTGTWGLILMGLMSVFMLGRLTRGEEEAGRAELLRSLPVGPHAPPAAAMITVAGMNVVAGGLVTIALVALDLPVAGSVAFGLSFTCFGLLLAATTSVAAQITENTRVVYAHRRIGPGRLLRAPRHRRHRRRDGLLAVADRMGAEDPPLRGRGVVAVPDHHRRRPVCSPGSRSRCHAGATWVPVSSSPEPARPMPRRPWAARSAWRGGSSAAA